VPKADLVVVSNRGPVSISVDDTGSEQMSRGGGGLVSGMQTALESVGSAVWVCAAMSDAERAVAQRAAGQPLAGSDLDVIMLPIDEETFEAAYNGVANQTLWFTLHMLFDPIRQPLFDAEWRRQWEAYQRFNQAFAEAVDELAARSAIVMVQDYHLFLLPALLRKRRPDLRIGFFTHTPWAPVDYFRILPDDVARDVVAGVLGADVVGFHTQRWAELFRRCAHALLGDCADDRIAVFGLTADAEEMAERREAEDVRAAASRLRDVIGDRLVIGRVDRIELSKNVIRGLLAYRELLRDRPQWRERVVHVVFDNPSREDIPEYVEYAAAVERLAAEIQAEFSTPGWTPLLLSVQEDYPAALAALTLTDVVLIDSVRDGMNLVVFEAILLAEGKPQVVLSRETGAADLLGDDAIVINPYDVSQTAAALDQALSLVGQPETPATAARAERLRVAAAGRPPARWFNDQVERVRLVAQQ